MEVVDFSEALGGAHAGQEKQKLESSSLQAVLLELLCAYLCRNTLASGTRLMSFHIASIDCSLNGLLEEGGQFRV